MGASVRSSLLASVVILGGAWTLSAQPASTEQSADLVFYGDTRGGVLQTFLNHRHRPKEIHEAVAKRIGSLEGLADQHAIVFLGDAVSHGGCPSFWQNDFFPALRNLRAFQKDQDFLFYPVIGDHETYLIPESYEEVKRVSNMCPFFGAIYKAPGESAASAAKPMSKKVHSELISERGIKAQLSCPAQEEEICKNPGVVSSPSGLAHCRACKFQREYCHGNCVTYAFLNLYSRDNGFGPFQDAWGDSPQGATWYRVDYKLKNADGETRKLRVLLLDTQADDDLKIERQTQSEWMAARVAELDPGAFVIVAGHQPPPLRPKLYEPIIAAAFDRGVRILAIVAAHYHGFGSGGYTLRSALLPNSPAQVTYLALSGDGGGRDFDEKERPTEDRMVGPMIGEHIVVARRLESPWTVDTVQDASSFVRLQIAYDGLSVTDYQVPLKSVKNKSRGSGPVSYSLQAKAAKAIRALKVSGSAQ